MRKYLSMRVTLFAECGRDAPSAPKSARLKTQGTEEIMTPIRSSVGYAPRKVYLCHQSIGL